ncbi:hypothetical protein INS49_003126 [Diaporthe citri]|uniref:uncharacterized protein n=1 Tax=Diaporthe citri TaxID=83186 RepID=UPI001C824DF0|nr:uncharacterized protein INS49_003126 [Diaporthe citri]KAG6368908.1 hypothetical protein INS49_003126 [Diaporthe citri]
MLEDYSLDNNLYRHPDRWGNPRVKFEKMHDIYALAIVLLEIALWKDIKSIVKKQPGQRVVSKDVKSKAKDMCQSQLPHRVGHLFAQAILTCLEFTDLTKGMSEYESQTYFQRNVDI